MHICVNVVEGNSKSFIIMNARYIRTVRPVADKGGQCPHYNAGARTYMLVEYNTIDESIVYVTEHISEIAARLQAVGRPATAG